MQSNNVKGIALTDGAGIIAFAIAKGEHIIKGVYSI